MYTSNNTRTAAEEEKAKEMLNMLTPEQLERFITVVKKMIAENGREKINEQKRIRR